MATPTVPASQSAAVMSAQIRASSALTETSLDAIVKIYGQSRDIMSKELLQLYKSVTSTRGELGKLGQDTFIELADLSKEYYKVASAGNVNPKDALDAYIKILGLEAKINKDMGTSDKQLLTNLRTRAEAVATPGTPEYRAAIADMYLDIESGSAVSPFRVATYDEVSRMVGGDLASVSADPRAAALGADVQQRKETSSRLSSTAQVIRRDIGDLAKLQQIANSGNGDLIKQTVASIAPTLEEATKYAQKFPGKDDLAARLLEDEQRIKDLKDKLDKDPMLAIQSFIKSSTTAVRDVDFYKTIGSTKFQRWAASNNLQVGKMRPATTDADKQKVGYISELNAVYEPGPDDQRSLVVAHNQSTMKPGEQLFTRRGLEARRNVEVQVGTKGAEREVLVDKAGQEVTPEEVAAQTKFTRVASVDGDTVYIRADGSGISKTKQYTQDDLAYASEKPLTDEQAKQVGYSVRASMFSTKKVAGDPSGVQTLRGRETAMLPTDPADTLYVIETTDGRRVPIRESQMLGETVIGKDEHGAKTKLIEEPRMALRKPLAMLRARGARLKEEAAPAEETEGPVGPLGRATDADKLLMSTAEVKALPGTKVVELPARPANEQLVRASRAPFTKTGIYEYEQSQAEAKEGLRVPLAEMRKKDAVDELRQLFAQERKDVADTQATSKTGFIQGNTNRSGDIAFTQRDTDRSGDTAFAVRPSGTASVGSEIRRATGTAQTGAAAKTVAASIPPILTGTPMSAPAMPTVQGVERGSKQMVENVSSNFGKMEFTPEELADMNTPETPAQRAKRKAQVMGELRKKYGDNPATAPIP